MVVRRRKKFRDQNPKLSVKTSGSSGLTFPDAKIAIYPAPKAARTSILQTLAQAYQCDGMALHAVMHKHKWLKPGPEYYRIGICRNPWNKMVSIYRDKLFMRPRVKPLLLSLGFHHGMPFDEFIHLACSFPDHRTEKHFRSQHMTIYYRTGWLPNYLAKFETLDHDWTMIQRLFVERGGRKIPPLLRLNVVPKTVIIPTWTPKLVTAVASRYEQDIKLFGYEPPRITTNRRGRRKT